MASYGRECLYIYRTVMPGHELVVILPRSGFLKNEVINPLYERCGRDVNDGEVVTLRHVVLKVHKRGFSICGVVLVGLCVCRWDIYRL